MGIGVSLELASSLCIVRKWSWSKVNEIIDTFLKEEYDFDVENSVAEKLLGLNSSETDALVVALTRRVDAKVNGITLLIALILLADEKTANVKERTEAIYRLMDFDNSGEITMEEMGIILFCLAMATSFILQKHRLCPTALEVKQINEQLFNKMGKNVTSCLSKDEFLNWADDLTLRGEDTTIFDVYKFYVNATGNEGMRKDVEKTEKEDAEHRKKVEKAAKERAIAEEQAEKKKADEEAKRIKAETEAAEIEAARIQAKKKAAGEESKENAHNQREEEGNRQLEENNEDKTSTQNDGKELQ